MISSAPTKAHSLGSPNLVFARHETFHPRFGWIKKGFDAVRKDPGIFSQENAHIVLGVGKNMGYAIKYWCSACKVIEQLPKQEGQETGYTPTQFGTDLFDSWDPYLEDTASLWLLHWRLLLQPCTATAWYFTFNEFYQNEFSVDELTTALCDYRDKFGNRVSESSIRKDVVCIIRMYAEQPSRSSINEESIDCPFVDLGILQFAGDSRHFAFRVGAKSTLPAEIIIAASLEFLGQSDRTQRTIGISQLVYGVGSPGLAFKITESDLYDALDRIQSHFPYITLSDSAGLVQMSLQGDPIELQQELLNNYYSHTSRMLAR